MPTNRHDSERKRAEALRLAVGGATQAEIAAAVGASESTIATWAKGSHWIETLARARRERVEAMRGDLDDAAADAVGVLREVMRDPIAPHAARVRAAEVVLDRAGVDAKTAASAELARAREQAAAAMGGPAALERHTLRVLGRALGLAPGPDALRASTSPAAPSTPESPTEDENVAPPGAGRLH